MLTRQAMWVYPLLVFIGFLIATNGFDIAARIVVVGQPAPYACHQSFYYMASQPIASLLLAWPFAALGYLAFCLSQRTDDLKAFLFFTGFWLVLAGMYGVDFVSAQQAMKAAAWTAATLSIGLLPFLSIPVLVVALIASRLIKP
jgi:hypothetical protein